MAFDVKITGGTVIDGTGAQGFRADVGIRDGHIVEVGACTDTATRTIDATGCLVTPGFFDLHTHYDGQVSWDADLAPSSVHGVTTAVMGNCGVGFAPVRKADRERLIRLMEGVEDIPGTALSEGMNWRWETFPEYLDAIDDKPHAIDFVTQVTHDALRVYVMGDRAVAGAEATDDDIAKMRDCVREALEAGAAGFSTGRTDIHRSADGTWTPAADAEVKELVGIAGAFKGLKHGVLQAVSDFDMERSPDLFDGEFDVLEKMLAAADGHPISISCSQRDLAPNQWRQIIKRAEEATAKGLKVRLQVGARGIGVMVGYELTFHPFMGFPSYKAIQHLPLPERVKILKDPAYKAKLLSEKSEQLAGDGSSVPPLVDKLLAMVDVISARLFRLGEVPNYEQGLADSLAAEAKRKGVPPLDAIYDALLEDDGKALLYFPIYNYRNMNLDDVREMLGHPLTLPGLSDGGAHVGTVCDASFPTFMLMHWARDRAKGRIPVERVVQMLASDTAKYIGLTDRGEVKVGMRADLNVIDFAGLTLDRPRLVQDLPAGGRRLLQGVKGYRATLVKGETIARDGELTGARPGRLVRVGRQ